MGVSTSDITETNDIADRRVSDDEYTPLLKNDHLVRQKSLNRDEEALHGLPDTVVKERSGNVGGVISILLLGTSHTLPFILRETSGEIEVSMRLMGK